jgi:hypothetical protein
MTTLAAMGEFINAEIKPDVAFWTGDSPPHADWMYDLNYI